MRIDGFDILRGLCAVGVAYYHILGWVHADDFNLNNIGLYGVYVFFILSGASIWIAYANRIEAGLPLSNFIALRFFRVAPLYWLAAILTPHFVGGKYNVPAFVLNLPFGFGFGNPGQTSAVTGGWSLGIEFVFYLIFPVLLAFAKGRLLPVITLIGLYLAQLIFISIQIKQEGDLAKNWISYTQYLGFAYYFFAGMLIAKFCVQWPTALPKRILLLNRLLFPLLLLSVAVSSGSYIEQSIQGWRAILLPLACSALVLSAAGLFWQQRTKAVKIFATLMGNSSYGVYLLHPLIYGKAQKHLSELKADSPLLFASLVILMAFLLALLLERYVERPIRGYGKRKFGKTFVKQGAQQEAPSEAQAAPVTQRPAGLIIPSGEPTYRNQKS